MRKSPSLTEREPRKQRTYRRISLTRSDTVGERGELLRPNPHMRQWSNYGAVHVGYGKGVRGGTPRRRTVLTVPEFDWPSTGCGSGSNRPVRCWGRERGTRSG